MKSALLVKQFDRKLETIIGSDLPILKKIKEFVIKSGGKRIRPLTHYYFTQILGYEGEEWLDVGAIGELIHAASLLHDDVVDKSELRRGKPTINKIYDNKTSILSGDFFLACGLDHLGTLVHSNSLLRVFTRVIRKLSVGELLQMEWERNFKIPEATYEDIILGKTAVLFGAMTESAAILAGSSPEDTVKYREFGERLGRIFQLRDDYLDYFGDEQSNGKKNYQDFQRGLVTRPVIVLRNLLEKKELKGLEKNWASDEFRSSDSGVESWLNLCDKSDLDNRLAGEIDGEIHNLIGFLEEHPPSKYSEKIAQNLQGLMVTQAS